MFSNRNVIETILERFSLSMYLFIPLSISLFIHSFVFFYYEKIIILSNLPCKM